MPMIYNTDNGVYEFTYAYIDEFVDSHVQGSIWNEVQLRLIVETLVNAIDTITSDFMRNGYIGSALWLFEQLQIINRYVREKGVIFFGEEYPELKKLEKPLIKYRILMLEVEYQPFWLVRLCDILTKPQQLCLGQFNTIKLKRLQKLGHYTAEQRIEAHNIIDTILTEAIDTLKNSDSYKQAKRSNHLYYDITENIPVSELDGLSLAFFHPDTLDKAKNHAGFFKAESETGQDTQSPRGRSFYPH